MPSRAASLIHTNFFLNRCSKKQISHVAQSKRNLLLIGVGVDGFYLSTKHLGNLGHLSRRWFHSRHASIFLSLNKSTRSDEGVNF